MKKAIRCCLSCILPCGSFDVIRIVHVNGRVEEISGSISASEIMKAYPKHVLKKPTSCNSSTFDHSIEQNSDTIRTQHHKNNTPRIVILPPDAQLERGKIYFLMPLPHVPPSKSVKMRRRIVKSQKQAQSNGVNKLESAEIDDCKKMMKNDDQVVVENITQKANVNNTSSSDDQYLSELLSEEKATMQRERRRGRVGVWRPHLDSICED